MKTVSFCFSIFALAGCSLINTFDDVKKSPIGSGGQDGGGTGGKTGGTGGSTSPTDGGGGAQSGGKTGAGGGGGAGGGAGSGGTSGSDGGGATGGVAGTGGKAPADSGADAFVVDNTAGVLVSYNFTDKKLYVLDPETGAPLSSEPMGSVRAIINDGATDNWYIFEATGPLTGGVTVHSRELNTKTGKWLELGKTSGFPVPVGAVPGVPTNRIAYFSDPTPSLTAQPPDFTLTVLDTTDPAHVKLFGAKNRALPAGAKQGVMAESRSLNVLMLASPCTGDAGACDVSIAHYVVSDTDIAFVNTSVIGQVSSSGNTGFATDSSRHEDVVAFPNATTVAAGTCAAPRGKGFATAYSSATLAPVAANVSFDLDSKRFTAATLDTCANVLFLTSYLEDTSIWAVPMAGGTPSKLCVGTGNRLLFEPYTKTLFRVTDTQLEAYRSTGTPTTPTIASRSLDKLPTGFVPVAPAVRQPLGLTGCK
jgi:hypothetical protein